jgi:hypothetical protein
LKEDEMQNVVENIEGGDRLGELGADGRDEMRTTEMCLKETGCEGHVGLLDSFGPGAGLVAGSFEHNLLKEPLRFLKCGEFIEKLRNYHF